MAEHYIIKRSDYPRAVEEAILMGIKAVLVLKDQHGASSANDEALKSFMWLLAEVPPKLANEMGLEYVPSVRAAGALKVFYGEG